METDFSALEELSKWFLCRDGILGKNPEIEPAETRRKGANIYSPKFQLPEITLLSSPEFLHLKFRDHSCYHGDFKFLLGCASRRGENPLLNTCAHKGEKWLEGNFA